MRLLFLFTLLICALQTQGIAFPVDTIKNKTSSDSLLVMKLCKTTDPCNYFSQKEKETLQWLNIARMYPKWFIHFTGLKPSADSYENSLYQTLLSMTAIKEKILPDSTLWITAKCHAVTTGIKGFEGHERIDKKCSENFSAECINYGTDDPKEIIYSLLVDKDVESLGHRNILLDKDYNKVGISIKPHKSQYEYTAVLDF